MRNASHSHMQPRRQPHPQHQVAQATIESLYCVRIQSDGSHSPFVVESLSTDPDSAITLKSHGGMALDIAKDWNVKCSSLDIKSQTSSETTAHRRSIHAESLDIMASYITCIGKKVRMQSSVDPFEIQSLNHTRHALLLRCPKGGMSVATGAAGINCSTSGNINLQLETAGSSIYIGAHGNKEQTVHIGTATGKTVVHSDLTIKGTVRLVDEGTSLEKHASVRIETANVVRLKCDRSDIPYDFGFVSKRHDGTEAGLVYDHAGEQFYFAKRLGEYRHTAFAPPLEYADACLNTLTASSKVAAPFVEAQHLQCKVLKHPSKLVISTPVLQCTNELTARAVQCSESVRTHELHAAEASVKALACKGAATLQDAVVRGRLVLKPPHAAGSGLDVGGWFAGAVGSGGLYPTLQDAMDADAAVEHVQLQPGSVHNCTALVNQARCVIQGNGSVLEGVLEVTQACTHLAIENATLRDFTIHTSEEYTSTYACASTVVLRSVRGTLKDCALRLPMGHLQIEHADLAFKNQLLGELKRISLLFSRIEGTPWCGIDDVELHEHPELKVVN
jgi:hypothetical protein